MRKSAVVSIALFALAMGGLSQPASATVGDGQPDGSETTTLYAPSSMGRNVNSADEWTEEDFANAVPLDALPQSPDAPSREPRAAPNQMEPLTIGSEPVAPEASLASPRAEYVPNTVGRLYFKKPNGTGSSCSAAVVNSTSKNTILTAAHCVFGNGSWNTSFVFRPAYHSGSSPFGTWSYEKATTFKGWTDSTDFAYDQAVIALKPLNGVNIVNKLGGNGFLTGAGQAVKSTRLWGYPADPPFTGEIPWWCDADSYAYGTRDAAMNCGFNGGASGGPWLKDRGTNGLGYIWAVTSRCTADASGKCALKTMLAAPNPTALKDLLK
jgi:V8-like Glu-specific endopeptidase